jgi:hypothetical protein
LKKSPFEGDLIPPMTPTTEIERMLRNSQTKVIMPIITLGLVSQFSATKNATFSDADIKKAYGRLLGK